MKILIDICHPAHAHFFKQTIHRLLAQHIEILITARDKDCTRTLLDQFGFPYTLLPESRGGRIKKLISRNYALYRFIQKHRPTLLTAIGGTFIAQMGCLTRIPSVVFYDGDNATLQNAITYPFANLIVVPDCYQKPLPRYHIRYPGLHELAYLHPHYFTLDEKRFLVKKPTIFIRLVAKNASHDFQQTGLNIPIIRALINALSQYGFVISSEIPLPDDLLPYAYQDSPEQIHHLLAKCAAYVGDSPTMACEAAILGVPAVFAATHQCGNVRMLQTQYQLVSQTASELGIILSTLQHYLSMPISYLRQKQQMLLNETLDVNDVIHYCLLNYLNLKQRVPLCLTEKYLNG